MEWDFSKEKEEAYWTKLLLLFSIYNRTTMISRYPGLCDINEKID